MSTTLRIKCLNCLKLLPEYANDNEYCRCTRIVSAADKPREWWVSPKHRWIGDESDMMLGRAWSDEKPFLVVPKTAYAEAIRERDEARALAERDIGSQAFDDLAAKLAALEARAQGLVEAIDKIMRNPVYTSRLAIVAWEAALAEFENNKTRDETDSK